MIGSTAQKIVNWFTTADGCVHTTDRTQLDFVVGKFVQTRRNCRQLVANSKHTADATQLDSCVASAMCRLGDNFIIKKTHSDAGVVALEDANGQLVHEAEPSTRAVNGR